MAKKTNNTNSKAVETNNTTNIKEELIMKMERANRITIQSNENGYEGRFYRTHKLLATIQSNNTNWQANADANSTTNREMYRAYLIEHSTEYGVTYNPSQQVQAWNRKYNSYMTNEQVAEDAIELVGQALDRLAEKSRYDMTIDTIEMADIRAKESTLSYVEDGKYEKSGAWCVADIEMAVSVTVNGHEMEMVYNMEMKSGQICKPKTTIAEWNEMVGKEMELNGIDDSKEEKTA